MNIIRLLAFLSLLLVTTYCNVENIRKARLQNTAEQQQSVQVDSFLYYQPVVLTDPFLDSLKVRYDLEQVLKVRIIPPAAPKPPASKQVQGFRVQTFAGIDSLNALVLVNNLKAALDDTIYFFKEKDLFKIQLGDYLYRNDADMKVLDLRKNGFDGAWIVQRLINIPIKADSSSITLESEKNFPFKIQILVTSDVEKAKIMVDELKQRFNMESGYIQDEKLYKIFLGRFASRADAEKMLDNVRLNGYKDAWLVHNK